MAAMRTDVLVVGGGLAGCAAAYWLAKAGAAVVLVERHGLNALASGANAGSIHAQIPHFEFVHLGEGWARGFAPTVPFMIQAVRLWSTLEAELDADLEFSLGGGLLVARTEAELRDIERKVALERAQGLPVELIDRAALRRIAPYLAPDLIGGSFCPDEGKANPLAATPAFARQAQALGATILRQTDLLALERGGQGFRARTTRGEFVAAKVVNCAGADAGRVAALLGIALPIESHPIQVNVTVPTAPLVPHLVYFAGAKLTLKQNRAGAFLIGGGWPARWDDAAHRPAVDPRSVQANLRAAMQVVPGLAHVPLLRTWPAIVNGTADWRPILGEAHGVSGFYQCCFPWMGFTAGPLAARVVADMVLGRAVSVAGCVP